MTISDTVADQKPITIPHNDCGRCLLLIGDSYGTERVSAVTDEKVSLAETWPVQLALAAEKSGWQTDLDFASYRMLIETAQMVAARPRNPHICIVQAGIVDIFPRTLPLAASKSRSTFFRILRRVIRRVRPIWIRFVYWRPWVAERDLESAWLQLRQSCGHLILVTYPALAHLHASEHPDSQAALDRLNSLIRKFCEEHENVSCCDLALYIQARGEQTHAVASSDSHLTRRGNEYLFRLAANLLLVQND